MASEDVWNSGGWMDGLMARAGVGVGMGAGDG